MQTHQRWSSAFINVVSTLIFGWKLSRRIFIDFVSTLTKQRWNNVNRITSIQSYNVEIWFESWADAYLSKLQNNIESIKTIQRRYASVVSTLKSQRTLIQLSFSKKYQKYQRWNNVGLSKLNRRKRWEDSIEKTLSIFVDLMFTRKWLNNETNLSFPSIKHVFFDIRTN